MQISVHTQIKAPISRVWRAYTSPSDIVCWNAASDDWHTPAAEVDLREGGNFCFRMESKDGKFGFDFSGTYTKIVVDELIEYSIADDRKVTVEFSKTAEGSAVRVSFEAESTHTEEQQRDGWQAILDNFKKHVESRY